MRFIHRDGSVLHLAYCSNVHPSQDIDGIIDQLDRYAVPVRERLGSPLLGVGLWLAAPVFAQSDSAAVSGRLAPQLRERGLEVVTLNGFPYKSFQSETVKLQVYRPNWADPRRLHYTISLAKTLAGMLPDDVDEGSISTLPLGWRTDWSAEQAAAGRVALETLVGELEALEQKTGKKIRVALEPEPGCEIETVAQAAPFIAELAPDWIGLCLDACHLAVQFEHAQSATALPIFKAQISSAISTTDRRYLMKFAEPRFMHQTRTLIDGEVVGVDDLPVALDGGLPEGSEWRVHFHVPVHRAEQTTQRSLTDTVSVLLGGPRPLTRHLELETYTWDVLPDRSDGDEGLIAGLAAELDWMRAQMLELGCEEIR